LARWSGWFNQAIPTRLAMAIAKHLVSSWDMIDEEWLFDVLA
jgi:hypothetical protein